MEMDINVKGFMTGLRLPEAGNGASAQRGGLLMIGFFLKDALKVLLEECDAAMSQCYYEQKIVSMYASQVDDLEYVEQLAYQTLHADMHMHPHAANIAKAEVARTICKFVQPTRATNTPLWTLLLEIHVKCEVVKDTRRKGNGRSGQLGCDQLVRLLNDDVCGVCLSEFTMPSDIVVTPCHHTYHSSCLFQWLYQGSHTCPICRSDVAPMAGGKIKI